MKKQKEPIFIVIFNGRIDDGCDYPIQTIKQLSQHGRVYGVSLGEPISWKKICCSNVITSQVYKTKRFTLIRPLFFIPGQRNTYIKQLNYYLNLQILKIFVQLFYSSSKKYIWIFEPFYANLTLSVFASDTVIYDCVDYFYDFSYVARQQEQHILKKAAHAFVNSHELQRHISKFRPDVQLVPLGFALDLFTAYRTTQKHTKKHSYTIGYIGGLDDRIDYQLLITLATHQLYDEFHFYGKTYQHELTSTQRQEDKFFSLPNVYKHTEVPKEKIPRVIDSFDICLIPYKTNSSFNRYCFPMKTMEYFYMEKPILSTEIKELHRYPQVCFMKNASEGARHIQNLKKCVWKYGEEEQKIAIQHSWNKKVSSICLAIGLHV